MKKIIGLLLIALVLTWLAVTLNKDSIESYLQDTITQELSSKQIKNITVEMDGREAYLSGEVKFNGDKENIIDTVYSIWGVGGVHLKDINSNEDKLNSLLAEVRAKIKSEDLSWSQANLNNNQIEVTGSADGIEDFEKLKTALSGFGDKVDNKTDMDWNSYLVLTLKENNFDWASAKYKNGVVILTGEASKQLLIDEIGGFFSGLPYFKSIQNKTILSAAALKQITDAKAAIEKAEAKAKKDAILAQAKKAEAEAEAEAKARKDAILAQAKKAEAEKEAEKDRKIAEAARMTNSNLSKCKQQIADVDPVYFATGSDQVSSEAQLALDKLGTVLSSCVSVSIQVSGHTDNVGNQANNLVLSQQRVQAVIQYLRSKGVASDQLKSQALSEDNPTASNDTSAGRKQNRRVDWQIVE